MSTPPLISTVCSSIPAVQAINWSVQRPEFAVKTRDGRALHPNAKVVSPFAAPDLTFGHPNRNPMRFT